MAASNLLTKKQNFVKLKRVDEELNALRESIKNLEIFLKEK